MISINSWPLSLIVMAFSENLFMTALLMTLLSIHMLSLSFSSLAIFSIHPATFILIIVYIFGMKLLSRTYKAPMWLPKGTHDTSKEKKPHNHQSKTSLTQLWLHLSLYSVIVAISGWLLAQLAVPLGDKTGLSYGVVGGVFTAVSTSVPELVVAIAAVRLGALNLAVGDIIGGNAFDTLFIAASDIFYRSGSIYSAITKNEVFWLSNTLVMTSVLLLGIIYRQRQGPANIGLESVLLIVLYTGGVAFLLFQ